MSRVSENQRMKRVLNDQINELSDQIDKKQNEIKDLNLSEKFEVIGGTTALVRDTNVLISHPSCEYDTIMDFGEARRLAQWILDMTEDPAPVAVFQGGSKEDKEQDCLSDCDAIGCCRQGKT